MNKFQHFFLVEKEKYFSNIDIFINFSDKSEKFISNTFYKINLNWTINDNVCVIYQYNL